MTRTPLRAGALLRRPIRRYCQREGILYTEDKGLLDSQFVLFDLTARQQGEIAAWVLEINAD